MSGFDPVRAAGVDPRLPSLGDGSQEWPQRWNADRGLITMSHTPIGAVNTAPYSDRSTYAHCVKYGPSGPVRIESMFPLGESGDIRIDGLGNPVFDPNYFSMSPYCDAFSPRPFPLFP
jgi:penicillin amidase